MVGCSRGQVLDVAAAECIEHALRGGRDHSREAALEALALRLQPRLAEALGVPWQVTVAPVSSQVGSGSLPVDFIPSMALALCSTKAKSGSALKALNWKLRRLPVPIVGRIADNRLLLDLRCLEDESGFLDQIDHLT